jgi:hypothetical protein
LDVTNPEPGKLAEMSASPHTTALWEPGYIHRSVSFASVIGNKILRELCGVVAGGEGEKWTARFNIAFKDHSLI